MASTYTAYPFSFQELSVRAGLVLGPHPCLACLACLAYLACLAAGSGCDRRDSAAEPHRAAAAPAGETLDSSPLLRASTGPSDQPVDPPAPPGNLAAEIEQFSTVEQCVASRARLDPLIGDALEAIGYDTFLVDACRVLDAAKARDGRRCETIEASMLRARCQITVAEILGAADDCPWQFPARPERGRDPVCVAIASGDARLCASATDALSRAVCAAVARHDAGSCAALPLAADRSRCARQAERWGALVQGLARTRGAKPLSPPAGRLKAEAGDAEPPVVQDLGADLERGVVLVEGRDGTRLVLGALPDTGPGFIAASPHVRASFGVEVLVPTSTRGQGPPIEARVERAQLVLPGRPAIATPAAHSTLVVKVSALEHERAGSLSLSLEGDLGDSISTRRIHVEASTFVRDIVKAAALYGPTPPAAGGMR